MTELQDAVAASAAVAALPLVGTKTLLEGATGVGKTHSLRTLAAAGINVRCIFTEPHARLTLADVPCSDGLHWMFIPPGTGSMEDLLERAEHITKTPWVVLVKEISDPKKLKYTGYLRVVHAMHAFKCDRCSEEFGDVTDWDSSAALAMDSLSGINEMSMQMFCGQSVSRSQPQWGAAQSSELNIINIPLRESNAHFILIAHMERQTDLVFGGVTLVPNALGKAIAPDLPKDFSDVVHCIRAGKEFSWSTATPNADLKAIHLEIDDKLAPDFGPLIDNWKQRGTV